MTRRKRDEVEPDGEPIGVRVVEPADLLRTEAPDRSGENRRGQWVTELVCNSPPWAYLIVGLALTVLSWPKSWHPSSLAVSGGFDNSWKAALAMAAHSRMPFGSHVVFNYGPLGFLAVPHLYYSSTAIAAFGYTVAVSTCLFALLVWSLRRVVPIWAAVIIAYAVGVLVLGIFVGLDGDPDIAAALFVVACVATLDSVQRRQSSRTAWMLAGLGGAWGILSLVKVSLAVPMGVALVCTVVGLSRRDVLRALVLIPLGGVGTLLAAWFATGGTLGGLVPFARGSLSLIMGYQSAESLEAPGLGDAYWFALLVAAGVIGLALAYGRGLEWRHRAAVVAMTAAALFFFFKEGFVRHDLGHELIFFAAAPILACGLAWPRRNGALIVPVLAGLVFVALAVAWPSKAIFDSPMAAVQKFGYRALTLAIPSRRAAVMVESRTKLQMGYALPQAMRDRMRGATVDVEPYEEELVWAYPKLRFDPLPLVQDFNAYTSYLDGRDARFLASRSAPRFILRRPRWSVGGRDPDFDPPATQLAIECHYRQVMTSTSWQLLEHTASRCGALHPIARRHVTLGQWITVPHVGPGETVVATFALPSSPLDLLEGLVYKSPAFFIKTRVASGAVSRWRFVSGTAGDPHVCTGATTLGYSAGFGPDSIRALSLTMDSGHAAGQVTVSFFTVRVHGSRPA